MTEKFYNWDIADCLDNEEMIAEYLNAAVEENDFDFFLTAINDVIRAKGMSFIADKTGLNRESLYKAFKPGSHPQYETVIKVASALGLRLEFKPAA